MGVYSGDSSNRTSSSRKEPYVPHAELSGEEVINDKPTRGNIPKISMGTGRPVDEPDEDEHIINIKDIKPETITKKTDSVPGVDMRESLTKDILKEGGIFDQYVEKKKKEAIEWIAEKEQEKEVADGDGEYDLDADEDDSYESNPEEEYDPDEKEILKDQSEYTPETEVDNITIDHNDESEEEEDKKKEDEKPFYQAMKDIGYEDDYEYPEDYDLPEDISEDDEGEKTDMVEDPNDVEDVKEEKETITDNKILENENLKVEITTAETEEEIENDLRDTGNDEEDDDYDSPEYIELRNQISKKITPKITKMGLEGYTIAAKPTTSNKIVEQTRVSAAKWALPCTGVCIQMKEISGQKIEYLRENMRSDPASARNRFKTLYDHVSSPKPASFEAWTKTIAAADADHLFMPAYIAAFNGSNYIPATCVKEKDKSPKETGCGYMFLSDNLPISDCMKFKNDTAKDKFWKLYDSEVYNSKGLYVSEVVRVSENFAIGFKDPSIYDVYFEASSFNKEFTTKYRDMIMYAPFIDEIYWLDNVNKKMVRVRYKVYENNATKTAKSKIVRYASVFNTFKADEYANVLSIISSLRDNETLVSYQIPEMSCAKCGRKIEATETTAADMLFTRHRLGVLANSSIK